MFPTEEIQLQLQDADIVYYPNFFNTIEADTYFGSFLKDINWQQDNITLFGKTYKQPRLTALYGTNTETYSYSDITMKPHAFTKELTDIKTKIETKIHATFTTCLFNLYRNGNDSNGWHADNEKELGKNPIIASASFGVARVFNLKHRHIKNLKQKIVLQHGSLLVMKGCTQHFWLHQIPKTKKEVGKRINLTFRFIPKKTEVPQPQSFLFACVILLVMI